MFSLNFVLHGFKLWKYVCLIILFNLLNNNAILSSSSDLFQKKPHASKSLIKTVNSLWEVCVKIRWMHRYNSKHEIINNSFELKGRPSCYSFATFQQLLLQEKREKNSDTWLSTANINFNWSISTVKALLLFQRKRIKELGSLI